MSHFVVSLRLAGLILLTGWLGPTVRAQCPFNIDFVQITDRLAEVRFETDTPGSSTRTRIRLGEDPSNLAGALDIQSIGGWQGSPGTNLVTFRQRTIAGLAPASTYYFDVQVSNTNHTLFGDWDLCETQHCPSVGAQPGGYECVDVGGKLRPRFTTAPAQGVPPREPNPPVHQPVSDEPPAMTGSTFPVAVDENNLCLNFQGQLDAAAAADADLVHEVVVPAGAVCRPENEDLAGFDLPPKRGSGTVVVRCDADPKLLPPPGVRVDPTFRSPQACSIETNITNFSHDSRALLRVPPSPCPEAPCTEGWRFVGFRMAMADHRKMERNLWPVLEFDAQAGAITVPGDLRDKDTFDAIQLNLPGIKDSYAHRSCRLLGISYDSQTDTSRLVCEGGNNSQGVYLGGGFASDRVSTPLKSCESGDDPICETAEPHPFGNYFDFPLLDIQGDTATTDGPHLLNSFFAVQVRGSTGGCDGFHKIISSNKSAGTMRLRPDPQGNCTGGEVRQVGPVAVFDTAGDGARDANQTHVLEVIDSTHFRLLGSTLSAPTVGGWMSVDPPMFSRIANVGRCRRCRFDRVLVEGGGKPMRIRVVFGWDQGAQPEPYVNEGAVLHSWIQDFGAWFPTHPVTEEAGRSSAQSVLSSTAVVHSVTSAYGLQLLNVANYAVPGIPVFSQSGQNLCAEDITMDRGFFFYPKSRIAGFPEAEGRYYPSRHFVEFKCVRRAVIRGMDMRQNPANSQPSGVAIAMSIQNGDSLGPPGSTAQDVLIEKNTIWENASGIDLTGPGSRITYNESPRRIRIAGNLVRTNRPAWKTNPSGQSGEVPEAWGLIPFYGMFFRDLSASTDLIIEDNTVSEIMGGDSSFLQIDGQYDGTSVFRRNIFAYSGQSFRGYTGSTADYEPPSNGQAGFAGWINHYRRGSVQPDPFSEWDNVAVPCVLDTGSSFLEDEMEKLNNLTANAAADFACDGGCPSNFQTAIVGESNQNCLTRQAALFQERMDYGEPAQADYPGYGADIEELRDTMGLVRDLQVELQAGTTAVVTYRAPDAAACFVDYGLDKLFWTKDFERVSDGGGAVNRQVSLLDLAANSTYHFRVLCSADQPRGVFTTGAGE